MLKQWIVKCYCLLLWALPALAAANPVQSEHLEVELVSEVTSIQPGQPFWVGLRLAPEEHWKTYWRNPGISGLPTKIDWQLPQGVTAGSIQWPYPERFDYQGIISYGYAREVLLLTELRPAPDLETGTTASLRATASWLVCNDICIPGSADLALILPVKNAPPVRDPHWEAAFSTARAQLPKPMDGWNASFAVRDGRLQLDIQAPQSVFNQVQEINFFPNLPDLIDSAAPQETDWTPTRLRLQQNQSDVLATAPQALDGVLVVKTADRTLAYTVAAVPAQPGTAADRAAPAPPPAARHHLLSVMLLALAGGFLLNLMPCVFPVLSMKAIGLMEAVHFSRRTQRLHGFAYTLGVMIFFCVVAGVLYLLKAGGSHIGWGFQLQSPWFVALLAYLLLILGLSFSGLLEIGSRFMGVGENLVQHGGYLGSFFTGALAAVVASPCTAPFMGSAVAFAITQPPLYSLLVFLSMGLGMALPFLLVAFVPQIGRILPKPGPWMQVFKQVMAFPLYLTVIWLLWVLGRQTDVTGMAVVLVGMVLLLFAVWLRRLKPRPKSRRWQWVNTGLAAAASLGALAILTMPMLRTYEMVADVDGAAKGKAKSDFWEPYSAARLAELRTQGQSVFVNVTADWCITCIANERVALSFPTVRKAFKERGIVPLKGDWTNRQPELTQMLESFGRTGVPLYVLYPPGKDTEPKVLPQWLNPMNVLDALKEIQPPSLDDKRQAVLNTRGAL